MTVAKFNKCVPFIISVTNRIAIKWNINVSTLKGEYTSMYAVNIIYMYIYTLHVFDERGEYIYVYIFYSATCIGDH